MTPEEYDAAARLDPAACPLLATGDRRCGRRLLADPADAARGPGELLGTAAGRAELDRISAAAEEIASCPATWPPA